MLMTDTRVSRFFAIYANQTAQKDVPAITSHFTDPFLFAGPSGTQSVRVADFVAALPKRIALFEGLGSQPTELINVRETPLDSRYVLARTTWRFLFLRDNTPSQQFDVDSSFLVDTGLPGTSEAEFKILLYLNHQDPMQTLRERGIFQT